MYWLSSLNESFSSHLSVEVELFAVVLEDGTSEGLQDNLRYGGYDMISWRQ